MQEIRLAERLVRRAEAVAQAEGARRMNEIRVRVAPETGISPERLQEQFAVAARGTVAEGAILTLERQAEASGAASTAAVLEAAEVEGR